jgi:fructose-specific phosphotransferase system IIC component
VGIGKAIELAVQNMSENNKHIASLRDYFVSQVLDKIEDIYFNGPKDMMKRLPSNANFSFEYIVDTYATGYGGNSGVERFGLLVGFVGTVIRLTFDRSTNRSGARLDKIFVRKKQYKRRSRLYG